MTITSYEINLVSRRISPTTIMIGGGNIFVSEVVVPMMTVIGGGVLNQRPWSIKEFAFALSL